MDGLIFIWTTLIGWALDMFPNYHLPTEAIDTIDTFFQAVSPWDLILPINEMISVLIIIFTIEIAYLVVNIFVGIIALVRGSGKPEI